MSKTHNLTEDEAVEMLTRDDASYRGMKIYTRVGKDDDCIRPDHMIRAAFQLGRNAAVPESVELAAMQVVELVQTVCKDPNLTDLQMMERIAKTSLARFNEVHRILKTEVARLKSYIGEVKTAVHNATKED